MVYGSYRSRSAYRDDACAGKLPSSDLPYTPSTSNHSTGSIYALRLIRRTALNKIKLFVYGTLRKDIGKEPTHKLPGYMMFKVRGEHFDFPYIQPYPWTDTPPDILGNIVEVSDEELSKLDIYENVKTGMYVRVHAIAYALGSAVSAPEPVQVYVGGPALVNKPIPNGIWDVEE